MEVRARGSKLIWLIVGLGVGLPLVIGLLVEIFGGDSSDSTEVTGEPSAAAADSSDPSGWQIVLIIGFIILSFIASGFLARYLLRRMSRSEVLEEGMPASAVIVSMAETGTTVNDHPMVDFELEVTRDGAPPYTATVRQMLPRLLIARVEPGVTVGVKVMADDPSKVAIDWESVSGSAPARPTQVIETGLFAGTPVGEATDAEEFLLSAIPAKAEIKQMSGTGITSTNPRSGAQYEAFAFVVTVMPEAQPAYDAKLLQGVPPEHIGRFGPGATMPVGVNPDDPTDIAINWREYERAQRRNDASPTNS